MAIDDGLDGGKTTAVVPAAGVGQGTANGDDQGAEQDSRRGRGEIRRSSAWVLLGVEGPPPFPWRTIAAASVGHKRKPRMRFSLRRAGSVSDRSWRPSGRSRSRLAKREPHPGRMTALSVPAQL